MKKVGHPGDDLVAQLCQVGLDAKTRGAVAYKLLQEVFAGYPIDNLRRLLNCDQVGALESGSWIISELGYPAAISILDEIEMLLDNESSTVRFWAVEAAHAYATSPHGAIIAKAIRLITDSDDSVRWKTFHFLSWASDEQLRVSIPHLRDGALKHLTEWLLEDGQDAARTSAISNGLASEDHLTRVFATVAAVRIIEIDRSLLELAVSSSDEEVSSFAREELSAPRRRR